MCDTSCDGYGDGCFGDGVSVGYLGLVHEEGDPGKGLRDNLLDSTLDLVTVNSVESVFCVHGDDGVIRIHLG